MPSFLDERRRYVLTTSYKVMYSTLARQRTLRELPPRSPWVLRLLFDRRLSHFMLTRDPYDRLASFYSDKLAGAEQPKAPATRWQRSQAIFFPHLGLVGDEEPMVIRDRLRSVSFERFVTLLDHVAAMDEHLFPQIESRYRRLRGTRFAVRLRVDRFVPIETEREFLRSGLSLDLGIHENRTTHVEHASLFTPGLYRIANRIYDRDFEELGYSRR